MNSAHRILLAALITITGAVLALAPPANGADTILSGTITSAAGEKLGGITVSAKPAGGTVTTSVFTDASGEYYFPPLPAGKYRVWAKAVRFQTAKTEIDLPASAKCDFVLNPMRDFVRQLQGNAMLAALPEETEQDKRMKRLVRNNCTGCHTASYALQHRFDEAGWNAIIELMKNANVYGTFMGNERKPSGILDFHQKELAAYLARARGPGESAMKFTLDPRPSGEAARVVFKEYDVPLDPDARPRATSCRTTAAIGRWGHPPYSFRVGACMTPGSISTVSSGLPATSPTGAPPSAESIRIPAR